MFVGTQPVLEQRTDEKLLKKFIESLFVYEKSICVYIRTISITIVIQNTQIIANICKQTSFYH